MNGRGDDAALLEAIETQNSTLHYTKVAIEKLVDRAEAQTAALERIAFAVEGLLVQAVQK